MANPSLGRNRLAMGFVRPQAMRQDSKSSGEISSGSNANLAPGKSSGSPIEISDDEMEDSEGGMVINVDQDGTPAQGPSPDDTGSEESGEIVSTPNGSSNTRNDSTDLFVVDPTPSIPTKRLVDLDAQELDDQLRYAFYHLNRDQIDLNRPVICLTCACEGHLHDDCGEKTTSIFPALKADPHTQLKLWVSCCACASKSHLVGDCPRVRNKQAARWSLKTLDPQQIINLSLETGTKRLEKEAENKNMRPEGLQIRGRAGLHQAGVPQSEDTSEDEPFLRRPVDKRQGNAHVEPSRSQRYDRYDAPSNHQPYRGGGQWYGTDSFGRRRSRSPEERWDSYRPREDYDRPRASQRDDWRAPPPPPPPPEERREPYRARLQSPPRGGRAPTAKSKAPPASGSGSKIQISLPTRKGSSTWSQAGQSSESTPTLNNKPSDAQQAKKRKHRTGRRARRKDKLSE